MGCSVRVKWGAGRRSETGWRGPNRVLVGWSNYFSYGTRLMAYRAVDNHVCERVRGFLRRRRKVSSRGTRRFSDQVVFGPLGVLRLRRMHLGPPPATA